MEIERASAAGIDAPAGIQFVPASLNPGASGKVVPVTMFKDTTGNPDRMVLVTPQGTAAVRIVEYKLLDNSWVLDPADCAFDTSVTLTVTATAIDDIHAFAIDDPAGTGDRVLFVSTNDASQTPDTVEINSIVLTPGASSLTAVLSVIAGSNQPSDTDGMIVISTPLTTTRIITFFQDDAHFADITEATGTYTFTYTDAKVLAVDTSIVPTQLYSMIMIGSQVVLANMQGSAIDSALKIWETDLLAVLADEFSPFAHVFLLPSGL